MLMELQSRALEEWVVSGRRIPDADSVGLQPQSRGATPIW